jgi:uncharacterized UPF0146 family protein
MAAANPEIVRLSHKVKMKAVVSPLIDEITAKFERPNLDSGFSFAFE